MHLQGVTYVVANVEAFRRFYGKIASRLATDAAPGAGGSIPSGDRARFVAPYENRRRFEPLGTRLR